MVSFLDSTKEQLGIPSEVKEFDSQLITLINSALSILNQLGFGPSEGYIITKTNPGDWDEFLPNDESIRNTVLVYIAAKVRLEFDPPTSSFVLTSLEKTIAEYEWRFNTYTEPE